VQDEIERAARRFIEKPNAPRRLQGPSRASER
jgi:hypothetical protein